MWFLEGFPVRTSAQQGKAPESKGRDPDCGLSSLASLAKYDRRSHTWKIAQLSLLEDSESSSPIWPQWGLMLDGVCWEQKTSALRMSENECGLWPTPRNNTGPSLDKRHLSLDGAVRLYPTPSASHCETRTAKRFNPQSQSGRSLGCMAATGNWPTPRANDALKRGQVSADPRNGLPGKVLHCPTPSATDYKGSSKAGQRRGQLTDPAMSVIPPGGQLNPTWVEWLMGWPLGWTELEPLETDKSHCARQQRGNC